LLVANGGPVLFFDGVCNLCSGSVQWIIRHDSQAHIRFAALQSELATQLLAGSGVDPTELASLVFMAEGQVFTHSTGVLKMTALLDKPWSYARVLLVVPRPIRDLVYRFVAKNRYRWFGQKDQCWIPTPALRARFLAD
jgi:predicted DCC family thiol-disulfide oxidoreductase YuxK